MAQAITTTDVRKAAVELRLMKRSLAKWMRYRAINTTRGTPVVRTAEQNLATKLSVLLGTMFPTATLPSANLTTNPQGAVQLANIALTGSVPIAPTTSTTPAAMSGLVPAATHPWLWPVLIVGGLLVVIVISITSAANLASQQEQDACIESGACTDYGTWLKWGGIAMIAYVAWNQFGVGDAVRKFVTKRSS
jgi:hypothetical protein